MLFLRPTWHAATAAAKSLQLCPTLCDPIDGSPPGSPVPGILQTRTLEWVAIAFSNAWKWKVKVKSLSRVPLLATPWTAAHQAPSMGFSRQEYWSGCHCLLQTWHYREACQGMKLLSGVNMFSGLLQCWAWLCRSTGLCLHTWFTRRSFCVWQLLL